MDDPHASGAQPTEIERILVRALHEAHAVSAEAVRPEHLVLAILAGPEGPARQALEACGVTYEAYRDRARRPSRLPAGESQIGRGARVAPQAVSLMARAEGIALGSRTGTIGASHLLCGLIFDTGSLPAMRQLRELGASSEEILAALQGADALVGHASPPPARSWAPTEWIPWDEFDQWATARRREGRAFKFRVDGQGAQVSLEASRGS